MTKPRRTYLTAAQIAGAQICLHSFFLDSTADRSSRRAESDGESQTRLDGRRFEDRVVESLGSFTEVPSSGDDPESRFRTSCEMIKKGSSWIRHAFLHRDNLAGIPDLLRRVDRSSELGDFSYEPVDVKNRRYVTHSDRMQLMAYAWMLSPVLGRRPEKGAIWLATGEVQNVYFTDKLERQFFAVWNNMKKVRDGVLTTEPVRMAACAPCQWNAVCKAQWQEEGHISMLSGVGRTMARRLLEKNIRTCRDVMALDAAELASITELDLKKTRQLKHAAQALAEKRIVQIREPRFPEGRPVYYYDIETYNDAVFLHGVIRREGNKREEKYFFAEDPTQEEEIWHRFLEYVSQDEEAVIYCWTTYEYQYVNTCWEKFGGDKRAYRILMKGLQDQCAFVKDHFVLPCRGYSLKQAAPVFGFSWQDANPNGLNCLTWYRKWLEEKDLAVRDRILEYNLDDVRAMEMIDLGLRKFSEDSGEIRSKAGNKTQSAG